MEHKCLATTTSRDEWLWHYKSGHLNLRDISHMKKRIIVSGLPEIHIPSELCGECVQVNKHKNKYSKDSGIKSRAFLEVIYSDVCVYIQVGLIGGNK